MCDQYCFLYIGNCGPLPESVSHEDDDEDSDSGEDDEESEDNSLEVTLTGLTREMDGELVAYRGARATYTCSSEDCMLTGPEELMCVIVNNTAMWYPSMAPYCGKTQFFFCFLS